MTRSAILKGRIDARDRARLRGRLDRPRSPDADPGDAIWAWLEESDYGQEAREDMPCLDLNHYLQASGHIGLAAEERLRLLAVFVEPDYAPTAPEALDRIYEAAVRLNPESPAVWHSRGISAKFAATTGVETKKCLRFRKLALRSLNRAWELDATDPSVACSLGQWHYDLGATEDAAEWFERALALKPDHGYALLYRAHCRHDQQRWNEAVEAYRAVPLETFSGPKAWLVDVVQEALAYCLLRAGDRDGALLEFGRLLKRFEKEPHRAKLLALAYLTEACNGPLRAELWSEYCSAAQRVGLPT